MDLLGWFKNAKTIFNTETIETPIANSETDKNMTVMDNLDVMVYVSDTDYNLLYVNRSMAEAYGVGKVDKVDKKNGLEQKCYKVIRNQNRRCSICKAPPHVSGGETFKYLWDDALGAWISGTASAARWTDGAVVYVHSFSDETRQKEQEESLRKAIHATNAASTAKSAFLANMSHEIRTPMISIVGFSELAIGDKISTKTREYLGKIIENSKWLLQVINDILDFSKIESGKLELESIPFELRDVFARCQAETAPSALKKDVKMYFYAEPSIGRKLVGDPDKLSRVLMNLLSNAVKFTNVGMVKLLSSVKNQTDNRVTIHFEVKDSGVGMTSEQIGSIYEPFMQTGVSTARKFEGAGLGLPIARNIIKLMGGDLMVESALGIGSKFSFNLTFDTIDSPICMPEREILIGEVEKPSFKGEILLCEDTSMNQMVICEHLSRVGLKTVVAENGKEGVEMVQSRIENGEKPFDLIFMDVQMPVMDGLEAASAIIKLGVKTPIVAITANAMPDDRELYRTSGMYDCVSKPFTSQDLWRCLLKYLTPVNQQKDYEKHMKHIDEKLRFKLITYFVKDNQTKISDINNAASEGDIKLACRLAHTLKGNAGLIGKAGLHKAAADVEQMLRDGKNLVTEEHMKALEIELSAALKELTPLLEKNEASNPTPTQTPAAGFDEKKAREIFEQLEPLLKSGNPDCLNLIDGLRAIPGSGELTQQMEEFDFVPAIASLAELKKKWRCG